MGGGEEDTSGENEVRIVILRSAVEDLVRGREFYERQEDWLGDYFEESLSADIDSLRLYAGVHAIGALGKASMKAQLKMADKSGADLAIILGEVEVREGVVIIRNMERSAQETYPMDEAVDRILEQMDKKKLDKYKLGE